MKTSAEKIQETLKRGYDRDYSQFLYKQMRYAFGHPWEDFSNESKHLFPDFPDIMPYYSEVGLSRRIQAIAAIALAKNVGAVPEPTFSGPSISKLKAAILQQFCNTRAEGTARADGNWVAHHARTFLDGDQLGLGFTRIGLKTNPKTGKNYVDIAYQPTCLTLWDRIERDPARANWVAFAHYVDADTAIERWGKKNVTPVDYGEGAPEMVRIFEYWDLGHGLKGEPTYALIPDDLDGKPLEIKENPFECLPFAHYEAYPFPGLKYPIGRVVMQMATQEAINQLERSEQSEIQGGGGFTLVNNGLLDNTDLKKVMQGKGGQFVSVSALMEGQKYVERVPPQMLDPKKVERRAQLEEQFNRESGFTELEQQTRSGNPTLGQDQMLQQQSDDRNSWSAKNMTLYYQRFFRTVLDIARVGDTELCTVNLEGNAVQLNLPGTELQQVIPETFKVSIGQEELTEKDDIAERALNRQELMTLAPYAQAGMIDQSRFLRDFITASGQDPDEYMANVQPQLMPPAAPPAA